MAALAGAAHARPWATLGIAVVITALLGIPMRSLELDAELTALLPERFDSIENLAALERRFGGLGYLIVLAEADDPEALKRFADAIAPRLDALEQVRYVEHKRPVQWFKDRALYFVDVEDLRSAHQRLRKRVKYEKRKRNPMYIDLEEDEEPPPLDFDDLRGKYEDRRSDDAPVDEYYIDPHIARIAVLVKPHGMGSDLAFARKLVDDVQAVLDAGTPEGITTGLTGRYKKWPDQQTQVTADLELASVLALALMIFYIAFHFRRLAAVWLIIAPLLLALAWTIGIAALVFEQLNILTGLVGAILLGLGIDHGIHLLGRYEAERDVRRAFGETGRAVTIAALTTLAAFGSVGLSEFRAFHEFGIVAAIGMALAVLSYTTVMPALIGAGERFGWHARRVDAESKSPYASRVERWSKRLLVVFVVGFALLSTGANDAGFDYDFRSLEAGSLPAFLMDPQANALLGFSEMPLVVLTEDHAAEARVVDELKARMQERGEKSTLRRVGSALDLVPKNQEAKQVVIKRIARTLKKVKDKWVPQEHKAYLADMKRMVKTQPFTRHDFPLEIRRGYEVEEGAGERGQVLAFPAIDTRDGKLVLDLKDEVTRIPVGGDATVSAAGEAMVMADVLGQLLSEITPILSLTGILVLLVLFVLLRSFSDTLLCLVPASITLLSMVALMPWADVKINYLNVIFVPVLFGVAVDGGVHIVTRVRDGAALSDVVDETGRAICGALLTTALGFGTLLLADHPGLNSVGQVMLLGITANLLACLVALPALIGTLSLARSTA